MKKAKSKRKSQLAQDVLLGLNEYRNYKDGEKNKIKIYTYPRVPERVDVKAIRSKLGMTQEEFTAFGFSLSAVRHWEAHRRQPEGSARILLMMIERNPKFVLETIN